jgi:two-component system, OmpR family, response regulator RegX3
MVDPASVPPGRRVLVVEDEESISQPLRSALEREGYRVDVAPTGAAALAAFGAQEPDLVLLDLMLPDADGRDLCRTMRASSRVPIIMLTARGEEIDRVVGLELGADDYLVKPFSMMELTARMRAVLRRAAAAAQPPAASEEDGALEVGDVRLDARTRAVTRGGEPIELARREFDLLRLLLENAGTVLSRERLMDEVWDVNWFGSTKTLDVHVSALRRKLGDDSQDPRYIHTVRGVGFRFASPQELEQ